MCQSGTLCVSCGCRSEAGAACRQAGSPVQLQLCQWWNRTLQEERSYRLLPAVSEQLSLQPCTSSSAMPSSFYRSMTKSSWLDRFSDSFSPHPPPNGTRVQLAILQCNNYTIFYLQFDLRSCKHCWTQETLLVSYNSLCLAVDVHYNSSWQLCMLCLAT